MRRSSIQIKDFRATKVESYATVWKTVYSFVVFTSFLDGSFVLTVYVSSTARL